MKRILILNGPNLNLLGKREPEIYGNTTFEKYFYDLVEKNKQDFIIEHKQTNHEGCLIDKIQEANGLYDGVILNAGGYTHTSVAIHDAIKAVEVPVVEVHISNINAREEWRSRSMISDACVGTICGFGLKSYGLALSYFKDE